MSDLHKMSKLKTRYEKLKSIDLVMQSRDRVEDGKRQRVLRIIELKMLILLTRNNEVVTC